MAKIVGWINAVLSGKLAGTVYANNKAGAYVRQYVIPTNANTNAQISARSSFTSAVSAWHALSDVVKAQWNSYALNHYASKGGVVGTASGFQAFVSLQNTARNANRLTRAVDWTTGATPLTTTQTGFTPSATPPVNDFSSNIKTSAGDALPITFSSATFDTDSTASVTFTFPVPQIVAPVFQDAIGSVPVGYNVYVSNALSQNQQFVENRYLELLGSIKAPTISSGWVSANTITATFSSPSDFDIPARKNWYSVGEVVQVSVYAVSNNGALKEIGAVKVTAT